MPLRCALKLSSNESIFDIVMCSYEIDIVISYLFFLMF